MFYKLFKSQYFKLWKKVEDDDRARIEALTFDDDVIMSTSHYDEPIQDNNEYKLFKLKNASKDYPLIIDIHGGAWAIMDYKGYDGFFHHLVNKKFNLISMSYPILQEDALLINMIKQIFKFLEYLLTNHDSIGVSLDNVFLTGDSAGGQLALLIYAINQNEKLQKIFEVSHVDISFKAIALNHPVPFLKEATILKGYELLGKLVMSPSFLRMMFGKKYKNKMTYIFSNPRNYLPLIDSFPPILLITSTKDESYGSNALLLKQTFDKYQIPYTYYFEDNEEAVHVYNIARPLKEISIKLNDYIVDFFLKNK